MDTIFHHTEITQGEVKRWNKYYAENKEKISKRRKERRALQEKKPVDEDAVKRYYELQAEMETLKPIVALWRLRQTLALKKTPAPAPGLTPEPPAILQG
jgi:hypothetical protein